MTKRQPKPVIKKLPPGRALGAESQPSTQSRNKREAFCPEIELSADKDLHRCMALWRAVFAQAIQDAKSRRTKPEYNYIRNTALHWLLHNQADFTTVCDLAGIDPGSARRNVREAQERGFIWRAGDGQQPTKHERDFKRSLRIEREIDASRPPRTRQLELVL